ncbi:MAG: helix-turn-helix domain-containing protein [Bifidobacterium mongoliense]|jgi:hypothetical protein|uniref:helix-turn-helix domain-containing protein n=1 Tax=Bifidobacterium mongoliense TaxID=518643 RepID=UPI002F35D127
MSYQASSWALREAPVGGDSTSRTILMALAEYADPRGCGAWPSVDTLSVLSRKSRRTVLRKLATLERSGVIRRGDQRIVSHLRADRRPTVWDLCMRPTGESGLPRVQEQRILAQVETDEVTAMTPRDEEPTNEVTNMTPRENERGDTGDTPSNPRGDKMVLHGVTPVTPDNKKENTNTPVAPKGPTTEVESKQPRTALADTWKPNVPARIYAAEHGIDLTAAVEKFRLWSMSDQRRCRNWDSRFLLWLHNEKPMQPTSPTAEQPHVAHTHTWRCDHVNRLLHRDEDEAQPDNLGCHLAQLLNDGKTDEQALSALGLSDEWEAA